jgi:hypothetical protein
MIARAFWVLFFSISIAVTALMTNSNAPQAAPIKASANIVLNTLAHLLSVDAIKQRRCAVGQQYGKSNAIWQISLGTN